MKEILRKYKEVISYLFFGVAATAVNIVVFFICNDVFGIDYRISNGFSWFFSVLFAFFTNKHFVFESKTTNWQTYFTEMALFFWYRGLSFLADMSLMIVLVEWIHTSNFVAKLITQVVVVILNYFFSKFFIFKNKKI